MRSKYGTSIKSMRRRWSILASGRHRFRYRVTVILLSSVSRMILNWLFWCMRIPQWVFWGWRGGLNLRSCSLCNLIGLKGLSLTWGRWRFLRRRRQIRLILSCVWLGGRRIQRRLRHRVILSKSSPSCNSICNWKITKCKWKLWSLIMRLTTSKFTSKTLVKT